MPTKTWFKAVFCKIGRFARACAKNAFVQAFFFGAVAVLALPPYGFLPALFIGFGGLGFLLTRTDSLKRAFFIGFLFGFAHFAFGLSWVSNALLVDEYFAWLAPFPPLGFGIWGGPFVALACLCAVLTIRRGGFWRLLALSGYWGLFEQLRGVAYTGFPWNLTATVWSDMPVMIQTASFWGSYGLSVVTVFAATTTGLLFIKETPVKKRVFAAVLPAVAVLTALAGFGAWRLHTAFAPDDFVRGIRFRLVQANIPQGQKWDFKVAERTLDKHVTLSSKIAGLNDVTHIVWPETATQFLLAQEEYARSMAVTGLPDGTLLLAGSLRSEKDKNPDAYPPYKVFNSIVVLNNVGDWVATYDKAHLVPFGEYAPLKSIFPFMKKVTAGMFDFSAGDRVRTVDVPKTPPVGMLVCYEVIFPGEVVDRDRRPYWLLNVTNDGWYGISAGPYQHFAAARMRAVEEGLPVVRSANTGISGVIDSFGRVTAFLDLGVEGFKDAALPRPLPDFTFFGKYGNKVPFVFATLLILFSFFGAMLNKRKKETP